MARLDLNAKRAARGEAENAPHEVVLGFDADGNELVWTLPPRMPLLFMDHLAQMGFSEAMRTLLGDQWERFAAIGPELDDLLIIAGELYGVGDLLGNPSASQDSSTSGGVPARPTSKPTTASTSPKPVTGRRRSASAVSSPS